MGTSARTTGLALLALAALAGCSDSSGASHSSANVSFVEVESNDTALTANIAGPLRVGDRYSIFGTTTDSGFDPFDGFAFFPKQALQLQVTLTPTQPGAVLQLCLAFPFGGPPMPPLCWSTNASTGAAFVTIAPGQELHLVVSSLASTSDYRLDVQGLPPIYAAYAATSSSGLDAVEAPDLTAYLGSAAVASAGLEPQDTQPSGALIVVDRDGEVRAFPIGLDARGPWIDAPPAPDARARFREGPGKHRARASSKPAS